MVRQDLPTLEGHVRRIRDGIDHSRGDEG